MLKDNFNKEYKIKKKQHEIMFNMEIRRCLLPGATAKYFPRKIAGV